MQRRGDAEYFAGLQLVMGAFPISVTASIEHEFWDWGILIEERDMYRAFLMSLSGLFLMGLAACDNGGDKNSGGGAPSGGAGTEQPATPPATNQ